MGHTVRIAAALVAATLSLAGCGGSQGRPRDDGANDIAVRLVQVESQRLSLPIAASGLIASETEARLSFKTGGIIRKILAEEGQRVNKGDLLATLNLTEIVAQVIQAKEAMQKAERDMERAESLYKDSVATLEQVQNARTAFNVAQQSLSMARYNLGFSEIRATTTGVVVKKLMNEGELVAPGTPVFFVSANGERDWVLKLGVADREWARIARGDVATVTVDAYPNASFPAKVIRLSEGADPYTGTYQVELRISPRGHKLATGMFGKAELTPSGGREYKVVPVASLVDGSGMSAYVFVPDRKGVRRIPVTVGAIRGGRAWIARGLDDISEIVGDGAGFLTELSSIIVVRETAMIGDGGGRVP